MDFDDFMDAYTKMSNIYYAKEMISLPAYFFSAPQNLDYAIGKAITISASTHHNLKTIWMIIGYNIPKKVEMNRLIRLAMKSILYLPQNFVKAKLMTDLLSEKVEMDELNKHYWHLMKTYTGIKAPDGHTTDTFDLPEYFYSDMDENVMSGNFISDILSYQIHKKLSELSRKYPDEPLHLWDISGSKDAGYALKKMMRLGSSKPFNEVLASMFPENPKVSADGLMEYFEPLHKMLIKKNKKEHLKIGWSMDG